MKRHHESHRREMLYAGTVAAAVINFSGHIKPGTPPVEAIHFVPDWKPTHKPARQHEQTLQQQIEILTRGFRCGPGKPN